MTPTDRRIPRPPYCDGCGTDHETIDCPERPPSRPTKATKPGAWIDGPPARTEPEALEGLAQHCRGGLPAGDEIEIAQALDRAAATIRSQEAVAQDRADKLELQEQHLVKVQRHRDALAERVEREAAIRQEALNKLAEADKAIERYKVDNDRMGWILDNGASLESFDGDGIWAVYVPRVVGPDVEWERLAEGHTPRQAIDAARTTLEKGESDE